MARPKSEFLSGLGIMLEIWKAIVNEVLSMGGGDDDLRRIITDSKLRKEIAALIIAGRAVASKVLEKLGNFPVISQPRFVARDHFKVDQSNSAKVRIWYLGDNFQNHFQNKIEEPMPGTVLAVHRLKKNLLDKEIRAELSEEKEEISLSQLWACLELQGQGQTGSLLTNGYANIFYIRDTEGALWAVDAYWCAGYGWYVRASSVADPHRWRADSQVVSRN